MRLCWIAFVLRVASAAVGCRIARLRGWCAVKLYETLMLSGLLTEVRLPISAKDALTRHSRALKD